MNLKRDGFVKNIDKSIPSYYTLTQLNADWIHGQP